ncbi:MAG: helix-turn-helix domain-containing protein [Candidatus Margulisiibacteriota bacterium]|nr:helix-turn-helix domain-containing protein [Candidatus Margulisiibacteriota bacterium]
MSEITKKLKLTPRTIRYYESEGLLGEVKRSIGYTRYFTQKDIERLKEVMALKKKKNKIADIKQIFKEKYPVEPVVNSDKITIQDTLITADDIPVCLTNEIQVMDSTITIGNVNLKYSDWETIHFSDYLKPFSIDFSSMSNEGINLHIEPSNEWVGNGLRCLVNYLLRNIETKPILPELINDYKQQFHEWLIIPVNIDSSYKSNGDIPSTYYIEKRSKTEIEKYIVFESDIFQLLEKQFKLVSTSVSGLLKQVTMHLDKNAANAGEFESLIQKLVPHHDVLAVEQLSPIYIESTGCANAILISVF